MCSEFKITKSLCVQLSYGPYCFTCDNQLKLLKVWQCVFKFFFGYDLNSKSYTNPRQKLADLSKNSFCNKKKLFLHIYSSVWSIWFEFILNLLLQKNTSLLSVKSVKSSIGKDHALSRLSKKKKKGIIHKPITLVFLHDTILKYIEM